MPYEEKELITPTLKILISHPEGLNTTEIRKNLMKNLQLSKEDKELSPTRRGEIKFEQIVRNLLRVHRNLERKELVTYNKDTGIYKITDKGKQHLRENITIIISLGEQGFDRKQIKEVAEKDFEDVIIEEGAMEVRTIKQRKRSNKLRDIAIKEFIKKNKSLFCEVCNFDFFEKYGECGKGYIEVHHKELVSEIDISGNKQKLKEALLKVAMLCSNCHKMIHRKKDKMLTIKELKEIIKK